MLITVDPASPMPLADQVAASVRAGLANGTMRVGDKLPSARVVASAFDINLHTVLRGYQRLRDEGLVELRRGRAAVIIGTVQRSELIEAAKTFARTARHLGVSEPEAIEAVRAALRH